MHDDAFAGLRYQSRVKNPQAFEEHAVTF